MGGVQGGGRKRDGELQQQIDTLRWLWSEFEWQHNQHFAGDKERKVYITIGPLSPIEFRHFVAISAAGNRPPPEDDDAG
jgi:hypothetical protein